ncbi:hypothetical protein STCU_03603 [Strigomonas culicis]|uniref:Mitochondrial import inner membrane translocase subunit n=1 Tax=Strigomonas culicis TaxID=28005 RepID=S9UQU3_9TRYP|nr:hypothetical protein STCU_03632 [Strigomonas culicis]EPY31139.1 hypothetical protein STCU_03603 [Strigomonas culicis]|eukprot:EPY31081.1 hypothetical protein STCU_03632 [Strigomonas culicis]
MQNPANAMLIHQSMEQYTMLDYANHVLEQCWDICYDKNVTREELTAGDLSDGKTQKMDACARKCVARQFEVMRLMNESRQQREQEAMANMAGMGM